MIINRQNWTSRGYRGQPFFPFSWRYIFNFSSDDADDDDDDFDDDDGDDDDDGYDSIDVDDDFDDDDDDDDDDGDDDDDDDGYDSIDVDDDFDINICYSNSRFSNDKFCYHASYTYVYILNFTCIFLENS